VPKRTEIAPAHIAHDIWNHLRLRFPKGAAAKHYNVLQKLSYVGVIFVLAPIILATGLTMSPGFDAACPGSSRCSVAGRVRALFISRPRCW